MVEDRIKIFSQGYYKRIRERVNALNEIEIVFKLIKSDEELQRFLIEYSQIGRNEDEDKRIDFYGERKLTRPKEAIIGVKARPKLATTCMLSIILNSKVNIMPLQFSREVFSRMDGYLTIDVDYHWDRYEVNESKSGGFYLKSLDMPDGIYFRNENPEGEYNGIRVVQVDVLKNLRQVDVIGGLERALLKLKKR